MRNRAFTTSILALVVAASGAVGCERKPKDRLQGRWLGETVDHVSPEQQLRAAGWVKGTAIEFSGNKVTVTIPAETPRTGTFRVARTEGERLAVSFARPEGGRDEAEMQLIGDDQLRWRVGGGPEIVMRRERN